LLIGFLLVDYLTIVMKKLQNIVGLRQFNAFLQQIQRPSIRVPSPKILGKKKDSAAL